MNKEAIKTAKKNIANIACRSSCMELIARTHPCWSRHSCFSETAENTSF